MTDPTSPWQPPQGFIQVESQVKGVTVFAPAPEVDATPEAQTFKCPQCGASTAYDVDASGVACEYCGYEGALDAEIVGKEADVREFTLEALAIDRRGWGAERRELHCDSCGADLSLAPTDLSSTCPFCASNRVVARTQSLEALRPRFLIPFKLDQDDCRPRARAWLGRGWMHPPELRRAAQILQFRGVYLPYWTFSAEMRAVWQAEIGYERSKRYYDHSSKTWKTKTVIDWRWESGRVSRAVRDLLESGTTKISHYLLEKLRPFELQALAEYEPGFLAGWQALAYDIPLPTAWDTARAKMRELIREACYDDTPTSRVRNFSMQADFDEETWRYILLPVFIAAFRFEKKVYQVMVNGQTGAVAGQKPVAWWKVWLAIAGLLSPGALSGLLGLILLAAGIGVIPLVLGGVLFAIGMAISIFILNQAMEAGKA